MSFWASVLYWEEKSMKFLFLLVLFSCSMTQGTYKKKFHLEDFQSKLTAADVHAMLTKKMLKCYPQSDYPVYEKTESHFDVVKQSGTISYVIDNQSLSPVTLVLVEIENDVIGSNIKVYAKGDLFRPASIYRHQIQKWLDGKKVDCNSHGEI